MDLGYDKISSCGYFSTPEKYCKFLKGVELGRASEIGKTSEIRFSLRGEAVAEM
jgi:hypothetical protein